MSPNNMVCTGILCNIVIWGSWFAENIMPVITVCGSLAGSIIAFVGLYKLIKEWFNSYRTKNDKFY